MLSFIRTASPLPIGVDIGAHGVRLVQLAVDDEGPRVVAAARFRLTDEQRASVPAGQHAVSPAAIAADLNRVCQQGRFIGREIVLSLPRELVQVKTVRLPSMPVEDLVQAAELDARTLFGVDERTATVRAIPAGEVRQGNETRQEVITLCVRNADVDALVEGWHAAGFFPTGIDVEPAAIYRTVERFIRRRDDESEVNVLVDLGARRTSVVIGRGREMNFIKSFEIGGHMLTHAVARKLGISFADAATLRGRLADTADSSRVVGQDPVRQAVVDAIRPICDDAAREVALCLRYYSVNFRGQRPSRVRITGGESADPTVLQLFAKALPVKVEAGKPILNADCSGMKPADRGEAMGEWTHAFGLALKFTKGSFADRSGSSRATQAVAIEASLDVAAPDLSAPPSRTPSLVEPVTTPTNRLDITAEPVDIALVGNAAPTGVSRA